MPNRLQTCIRSTRSLRSFTLVEVLLAMCLTGLVVALIAPLTLQVAQTRSYAQRRVAHMERKAAWDHIVWADFAGYAGVTSEERPPLVVVDGAALLMELPVLSASPAESDLHVAYYPSVVRYWRIGRADGRMDIARELIDLTRPSRASSQEIVARNVTSVLLEIRRRREWTHAVALTLPELNEVNAIRIRIEWPDDSWTCTFEVIHAS